MNTEIDEDDGLIEYAVRPNKSQIKREIEAIADIVEQICNLSASQIEGLGLPENIQNSVFEATKMPHKGARKRLLKFITAQLRKIDIEPIEDKLSRIKTRSVHAIREHHQAESWRNQLLSENGRDALTQLLIAFPQADSQHLRQLQRNAFKERQAGKPPRSARLLYQYLKQLLESPETSHFTLAEETSE